jgi:N-acetylglutamate synthase-like GNAT family acetyltransferase
MNRPLAPNEISLRDTSPEDEEFLLQVYYSTRADEMDLVPWTDEQKAGFVRMQFNAQHAHYHQSFPAADYKIVLRHEEPVGRLYVHRDAVSLQILDVTIVPAHRNEGIGSGLIQQLVAEATRESKVVRIHVESFNPSQSLFQRLGFSMIEENGFNHLLEWRPTA